MSQGDQNQRSDDTLNATDQPDELAEIAVRDIETGTVVALGTGRAASRAVRALARRAHNEGLTVKAVPTSDATERLARELGLNILPLRDAMHIDTLFDGADEVDPQLRMIKGAGGAMTREKIAAHAAQNRTYLINESKLVERLGERVRVPVEVLDPALAFLTVRLEYLGLDPQLRLDHDETERTREPVPYRTDNNNPVLDITAPTDRPADDLDVMLRLMPGIVGHGLFLTEADRVVIETASGPPRILERPHESDPGPAPSA